MIVKNEEKVLNRVLKSAYKLFDEIIIVDTGSTDKTKEIAGKYTTKILDFEWINDFSKARNYAFNQATSEYIMWLDADDVILKDDFESLREYKKTMDKNIDICMMKYDVGFDENGKPNFSYYRERLIKNDKTHLWNDRVHEYINLFGKIDYQNIAITHKKSSQIISDRNLKIYENMLENGEKFSARNKYYYGRELKDHRKYEQAIKILAEFLNEKQGWVEDNIAACHIISDCYNILKDYDKTLEYLYKSFQYDNPRAKTCTLIGNRYLEKKLYERAKYWYEQALKTSENEKNLGFYENEYHKFIPTINLVVCYDELGSPEIAKAYHEASKKINPNHPSVIYNDQFFKKN